MQYPVHVVRRSTRTLVLATVLAGIAGCGSATDATTPGTPTGPTGPTLTTGVNDASVQILSTSLSFPYNIVVDASRAYWIDADNGSIKSVPINGGTTTTLSPAGVDAGFDLAQDATSIYFTLNNLSLRKVAKTGGAVSVLAGWSTAMSGCVSPTCSVTPSGVVVSGSRVIFGNSVSGSGASPNSGPATVSGVMSIGTTGASLGPLATNAPMPVFIGVLVAVDATKVYFAAGGSSSDNKLQSAPLSGGTLTSLVSGVGDMSAILAPTTGAGAGSVFFMERALGSSSETLRRLNGTTITVLATIITQHTSSIAIDDAFVYYPKYDSESGGSVIAKQSLTTGVVTILAGSAKTNGIAGGLAVDGTNVYWTAPSDNLGGGSIRSVPKS